MDEIDKKLLNEIQSHFPIESHPYRVIGAAIGLEEQEVLARIGKLKKEGIVRRMGASINSRRVGFVSTLLAAKVAPERLEPFVRTVNECPGVTHNYERDHAYNVWFTLIAPSQEDKERSIRDLVRRTGIEILELPAKRIFKIKVDFRF